MALSIKKIDYIGNYEKLALRGISIPSLTMQLGEIEIELRERAFKAGYISEIQSENCKRSIILSTDDITKAIMLGLTGNRITTIAIDNRVIQNSMIGVDEYALRATQKVQNTDGNIPFKEHQLS